MKNSRTGFEYKFSCETHLWIFHPHFLQRLPTVSSTLNIYKSCIADSYTCTSCLALCFVLYDQIDTSLFGWNIAPQSVVSSVQKFTIMFEKTLIGLCLKVIKSKTELCWAKISESRYIFSCQKWKLFSTWGWTTCQHIGWLVFNFNFNTFRYLLISSLWVNDFF